MKLINTANLVKVILIQMPEARNDDYLLWLKVIETIAESRGLSGITKLATVEGFLMAAKYSWFPQFETVSRARRKIQERCPELRGSAETQAARSEKEEEFKNFARNY